jgi:hypothetical protein
MLSPIPLSRYPSSNFINGLSHIFLAFVLILNCYHTKRLLKALLLSVIIALSGAKKLEPKVLPKVLLLDKLFLFDQPS